jgi:D-cysteine desulfhydrase
MIPEVPFFEQFPGLKEGLPYERLCDLPSPVNKPGNMGEKLGLDHLYMKQDGIIGRPFGGNKLRKLEFLIGEARRRGCKEVMTFGFAGSNHALATAVNAYNTGLMSISMLLPQPNAHYVRRNLLLSRKYNAELHHYPNKLMLYLGTCFQLLRHRKITGKKPYVIPPGGSLPLGLVGFVNAAFELKRQIQQGQIPEPDRIYLPLGSGGTYVGLLIGLKALDLKSKIFPVRIVGKHFIDESKILKLFRDTVTFLCSSDPLFPRVQLSPDEIEINDDFLGEGYARFTKEGMEAAALMKETEGVQLDGAYTGKTFAALIADARGQKIKKDDVVLFWNTLNAEDFSHEIEDIDYHELPKAFHRYFEQEVQPLDR